MKRTISLMLVVVLIVTMMPTAVFADYSDLYENFDGWEDYVLNGLGEPLKIDHPINGDDIYADKTVYNTYKILCYGNHNDVDLNNLGDPTLPKENDEKTDENGDIQFRYLGYSKTGKVITNTKYPNDETGTSDPLTWLSQFFPVPNADATWIN
jgi:hypothetical protein